MNRNEKVELVASLHRTLSETAVVVVTQQVGMDVDEVEQLPPEAIKGEELVTK